MECEIGSCCTEDDPGKARQTQGDHCVVCGHPQVYDLAGIYVQIYMKTNVSKSPRKIPHTWFFPVILCNCVLSVIETVQMIRLIMCKWYVVNFSGAELTITCLFFPTQWYDPGQWWLKRENNFLERKTRDTNQGLNVWKNSINSREIQYQYIYMQYLMIAKL